MEPKIQDIVAKELENSSPEQKAFWKEEERKCNESPYYFYTTYLKIDGEPPHTMLSEEEFDKIFLFRKKAKKSYKK
jgi:hypothetical protein